VKMGQAKDVVKSKPNPDGKQVLNIYELDGKLVVEYKEEEGD